MEERQSEIKEDFKVLDKIEDASLVWEGGMQDESEEERARRKRINDEKKQRQMDEKLMKHLH